jgi:hypothetical protein
LAGLSLTTAGFSLPSVSIDGGGGTKEASAKDNGSKDGGGTVASVMVGKAIAQGGRVSNAGGRAVRTGDAAGASTKDVD